MCVCVCVCVCALFKKHTMKNQNIFIITTTNFNKICLRHT